MRKEPFTSEGFVKRLLSGEMSEIPSEHFCMVDVRDCAMSHLLAVKNPAAANRRFILCKSSPPMTEWGRAIVEKYKPLGWPVTENFQAINENEVYARFNNDASVELGVQYRDIDSTMIDMADKMVELGKVVKPAAAQE